MSGATKASITVEVAAFAKALAGVCSVVYARSTIPILSNIAIRQASGMVRLVATDLDIEVRLPIAPSAFDGEMAVTVEAARLSSIFRNLDKGAQAKISLAENGRVLVTSGRSRFTLPSLPIADFPQIAAVEDGTELEFPLSRLKTEWGRLSSSISTEEVRYYLCGISMRRTEPGKAVVNFAATNGHTLVRISDMPDGGDPDAGVPDVIIPSRLASILMKIWDGTSDDAASETVRVTVTASKMIFRFGDWHVTGKMIDGQFPDYERVIPRDSTLVVQVACDDFAAAVRRALLVSSEKSTAVKILFEKDKIIISVADAATGTAREEVAADYHGDTLELGVNGKYLIDMLSAVPGGTARILLADASAPIRFESMINDSGFTGVVMPVRV
ncbi:MAG: DNA polymerase III subunit beta [Parasphingorhabdus sp.]